MHGVYLCTRRKQFSGRANSLVITLDILSTWTTLTSVLANGREKKTLERGKRRGKHSFISFAVEVRKRIDAYDKAVAVPLIGIICKEKDASKRPGLCRSALTREDKAHALNLELQLEYKAPEVSDGQVTYMKNEICKLLYGCYHQHLPLQGHLTCLYHKPVQLLTFSLH